MELRWPTETELPGYVAALGTGWSPNTMDDGAGRVELAAIAADPATFLASLVDRDASGPPIELPDGSVAARLPGYRKWMWDGEFCGSIGFRWWPGSEELPPHVLGHIGYAVVPWKRGRGYATTALGMILADAAAEGLRWIEITTDPDNVASQRVIERNGGVLVERFAYPVAYG
ncbi:MAG: GNAT family N-acetyltransferase, partial [Ilumatobacteraceae bacterium]